MSTTARSSIPHQGTDPSPCEFALLSCAALGRDDGGVGGGDGGGDGDRGKGGGDAGGGKGASRVTWTATLLTEGAAGGSRIVTPNALLIASRGFVCISIAASSTWLPEVSVATTIRITLPAVAVTVSSHAGMKHCSSRRRLLLMESAFASYSSMVAPALSTRVISLAGTILMTAPGCNGDGGGCEGGGLGGGEGCGEGGGGDGGGEGVGLGKGGGGLGEGGGGEGEGGVNMQMHW